MIAFWSAGDNKRQCISYSSDHGRTWTKYDKNPVLEHPYRDPKVFWHEPSQKWIMVLCGPPDFHYFILTSSNLLRWEEQSKIPDMYECPDMFPLPVDGDTTKTKWVIVNGDGQYLVGDFDGREFKPLTGEKRCEWGEVGDATLHATRGRASAGLGETGLGAAASTASAHPPIPGSSARNRT
jgi:sucrose-6-phosphate hydrolase SacC (GH32 family)